MSRHREKATAYVRELQKMRKSYSDKVPAQLRRIYGKGDHKADPDFFRESSFLYIRSYPGDIGVRPFSGINFWNSPDLNVSPINQLGSFTTELEAGKTYNISCRLNNRGDLMIPYPKVEFFLTNPTLGFNTQVADLIGLTQLPALLLPNSNGVANYQYQVPSSEAGHKCLFARTYSLVR